MKRKQTEKNSNNFSEKTTCILSRKQTNNLLILLQPTGNIEIPHIMVSQSESKKRRMHIC